MIYETDSDGEEDETDDCEDEKMHAVDNPSIYVRKIKLNETTKGGKRKKSQRVYNVKHARPFGRSSL